MKCVTLVLPLVATLVAVEAKLLSSQDIDVSCGDSTVSTSGASVLLDMAVEVESLMKLGVEALQTPFTSLSADEQIFQQLIMGIGPSLTANRQAAADFLQTTLSFAQTRARTSSGRSLRIQCGEGSLKGVGLASDPDAEGKPTGLPFLYNFVQNRKVTLPLTAVTPSVCSSGNVGGYVDGSVMVLCARFWETTATVGSSRPISKANLLSDVERKGKLIIGDRLDRIRDIAGFSLLHELMHWGTWDGVNTYAILDVNGYSWNDIASAFANSPANTAQFYPFVCYGTQLIRDGYGWSKDGKVIEVPS